MILVLDSALLFIIPLFSSACSRGYLPGQIQKAPQSLSSYEIILKFVSFHSKNPSH